MRRIQRWVKSTLGRGYTFKRGRSIGLVMPARVTQKALTEIRRLKPEVLLYAFEKLDAETGELVSGNRARKLERSRAAKKAAETRKVKEWRNKNFGAGWEIVSDSDDREKLMADHIISVYRQEIADLHPAAQNLLNEWLDKLISKYGESKAAGIIRRAKSEGIIIEPSESYKYGVIMRYLAQMTDLMRELGTSEEFIVRLQDTISDYEDVEDLE